MAGGQFDRREAMSVTIPSGDDGAGLSSRANWGRVHGESLSTLGVVGRLFVVAGVAVVTILAGGPITR